jgi:translocation and assembly module TamB
LPNHQFSLEGLHTRWKLSKPVRITVYLVESLLALALAALIAMSTSWFQHVLERHVILSLENLTGGRVEVAGFRFKPWLFQVTLQRLVIHGSEAAGSPPLVSAREVEAGLNPGQLVHRRLRLRHLDINELQVHLLSDRYGVTNLPGLSEQSTAQRGLANLMDLSIGRLTISHSAFFWNNQRQPFDLDARELAILLRMTRGRYNGTLSSSATTIRSAHWLSPNISFNSRFELSRASVVFSSFAWQAPGTTGEASFKILPLPQVEASGSFQASAEIPVIARVFHTPELRAGNLQIEGLAVYEGGCISARGRGQARQMTILSSGLPPLHFDATSSYAIDKGEVNLTNLLVSAWGGTVGGTLQANFQASPAKFRLHSSLHQVRLDELLRSATAKPLRTAPLHFVSAANGNLDATWSGQFERMKANFNLTLHAPAGASRSLIPVSGSARGTVEAGNGLNLHLAGSELQTPHSTLKACGTLTQRGPAPGAGEPLALTISTDDFEEWRPIFQVLITTPSAIPLELKSRAEFSGQLSGNYELPALAGHVKMGQFQYHGWTWNRLTASVALNPSLIRVSDGRVEQAKSSFELSASAQLDHWQMTPGSEVRISAQAQRTPIEGLKAAINMDAPIRGSITGRVDVEGTTANLAGSGFLRIDDGTFADEPFDSFSTQLKVMRSTWKLQAMRLTKKHGHLTGDLTLEPQRHFAAGQVAGIGFRLADIQHLPIAAPSTHPRGALDGNLNFEVSGQGTPDSFHLQGSWNLRNLGVAGTSLGELHGVLTGEGQQLRIAGDHQGPAGTLHFIAQTTAQGDWPMVVEGQYSELRVDPWIQASFNHEFAAAVTLGGTFRATGPLRTPEKINLQSQARDVAVSFPSFQWRNSQPVDVYFSGGTLSLSRFVMRGPSTELEIKGAVRFAEGAKLALSAEGTADAKLLTAFDPNLQATGRSALHLHLTGTPARPVLNGTVDIQDVSVEYPGLPFRFNNLQGVISLEGERAVIRSLHGTSGGGTVNLSGFVTLVETPRFEVRADLNQVRVRYPASFTSVLDGNLRLAGTAERGQVQGELVVRQMIVNENVNFIGKIIESSSPVAAETDVVTSPLASKIRLNVRVTSAPPVQVQTSNLRLVGDIDIRMQGTLASPVQVGSIHLLNGESVFRGNRFTLVRGDINLTNPFRTQTYLDIEARTRVQSYDLTLDISGPFERMKFAYRSDPPLPTTDILSLLALGYVRQEGAFSTVGGNPTASIGASAILSEALSSQVTGRIQHLFGVSRIKVDPNVGVPGFGSGARVTVEQQVTHELTLTYVTDTSYSQYRIIQFEWNVSNNVSLLGIRDQNGIFGIEFRFRRRFK